MLPPRPPPGGASAAAQPPWRPWSAPLFESELQRVPMLWDDPVRFRMTNMTAKMAEAGLINPGDPATPLPARHRLLSTGFLNCTAAAASASAAMGACAPRVARSWYKPSVQRTAGGEVAAHAPSGRAWRAMFQ